MQPSNGEESFKQSSIPDPDLDPDNLIGGSIQEHTTYCVNKMNAIGAVAFGSRVRAVKHTSQTDKQNKMPLPSTPLRG